jgi:hypothetical protein
MNKDFLTKMDNKTIAQTSDNSENSSDIMFRTWQQTFPNAIDRLNNFTAGLLRKTLTTKFSGDINRWNEFLKIAKTCTFLQDKPHLVTLDWILKDKSINTILAGGYGASNKILAQESSMSAREQENLHEAIRHIRGIYNKQEESEICVKSRIGILQNLGSMKYHAWFLIVKMVYEDGDEKIKLIGSNFVVDTTEQRYGDWLKIDQHKDVDIDLFLHSTRDF